MSRSHRFRISSLAVLSSACALVAWSAVALAQPAPRDVACRATETQPECHARLKCKANEELEDCQRRLLRCKAGEGTEECKKRTGAGKQGAEDQGGDAGDSGRDRDEDRGRDDRGDSDRGDRWRDRDDDGGGGGGDSDRGGRWGDRDDDGGGGSDSDRGGRWGDRGDDDGGGGGGGGGDRWRDRGDDGGGSGGRGGGSRGGGGGGDQGNKTFGLGLEVGEPTGLNGKYFLSETGRGALDFGVGWIYRHYYYDDGLHLYVDYLYHPTSLASTPTLELPFYVGIGLRFWDFEYCDRDFCYDGTAVGIRVPIGLSFDFNNAPIDIFLQLVPVIDRISDDYYDRFDDRTHVGIDFSAGIRFWFN